MHDTFLLKQQYRDRFVKGRPDCAWRPADGPVATKARIPPDFPQQEQASVRGLLYARSYGGVALFGETPGARVAGHALYSGRMAGDRAGKQR